MISTRSLIVVLVLLLLALQYKLWFASNGVSQTLKLKKEITLQKELNKQLVSKNKTLTVQVQALKNGKASMQDLARDELGMIKPGEKYYKFVR